MKKIFLCFVFIIQIFIGHTQVSDKFSDDFKIMFYNTENFFDTYDDPLIKDEEFLPEGNHFWNNHKYYAKLYNVYKVIVAIGQWNPPAIIGLCEIENRKVLNDIVYNTPLVKFNYKIIHKESPDRRGIDVGFLYREDLFKPIQHQFIAINYPDQPNNKTRDIVYVKGIAMNTDTLHVFINHWPSRWGGQLESEDRRLFVASVLKTKVDSILASNPSSNIVITGDFNDYPDNKSIHDVLGAQDQYNPIEGNKLYNLSANLIKTKNIGSHKYQGEWGVLDQFIVSGNLLKSEHKMYTSLDDIVIFNADFLLEPDEGNYGFMPKRTFIGFKYNGGFSDHLPTYLVLKFNN